MTSFELLDIFLRLSVLQKTHISKIFCLYSFVVRRVVCLSDGAESLRNSVRIYVESRSCTEYLLTRTKNPDFQKRKKK